MTIDKTKYDPAVPSRPTELTTPSSSSMMFLIIMILLKNDQYIKLDIKMDMEMQKRRI